MHGQAPSIDGQACDDAPKREPRRVLPAIGGGLYGLTVLVVEDDDDAREMLVECMTLHGARTIAASSAAAGYETLARHGVDAIVTDVAMPGEDGITMVKRARSELGVRDVPCVVLSGNARREEACEIDGGPVAFFQKPVDIFAVVTAVRALALSKN